MEPKINEYYPFDSSVNCADAWTQIFPAKRIIYLDEKMHSVIFELYKI